LMLLWCLSGVVMLFVHWPEVGEDERQAGLAPIDWARCCHYGGAVMDVQEVRKASVEMVGAQPVLRADGTTVDLATGQEIHHFTEADARAVATTFAKQRGIAGAPARVNSVERDQWTVTGYFNTGRPFWRVRLSDPGATDLYVSARTGKVAQRTDRAARVLNWFGAIPHWLYPRVLRADVKLWAQVVIWTSIAGTFLTATGLYLGIIAWRPGARPSPFRGLMAGHHIVGLIAGLLTLTWVVSGLVSMNPWGFLESPDDPAAEQLSGEAHSFGDIRLAIDAAKVPARQLRTAPFQGELHLAADGRRLGAPLTQADVAKAARGLGRPVANLTLITEGDAYYFSHHEDVRLPAWRISMADGDRYYLDPATGELLASVDAAAKSYRWLHLGLHRLDVIPGFSRGWAWATAMTLLLLAATLGVATGVWLGWRRVKHDLAGLRRRKPSRHPPVA
ncbi:MAG: hypothetical protein ABW360_17435, partial [Phenylobacterium sp.]